MEEQENQTEVVETLEYSEEINRLKKAIDDAKFSGRFELKGKNVEVYGLSSVRGRNLLHNICKSVKNPVLVEVGSYRGATLIAACYNKKIKAFSIDNYTFNALEPTQYNKDGWNNIRIGLRDNLKAFKYDKLVTVIEGNSAVLDFSQFIKKDKVNIIHYDGDTSEAVFIDTIGNLQKHFDREVVLVVSYLNTLKNVKYHLNNILKDYIISFSDEYFSPTNADGRGWWAGMGIYYLKKIG